MPHVSKVKIEQKYLDNLYTELLRSFERSFKQGKTKSVFYEFFTPTEKIMFAKRLAVIALLSRKVSQTKISRTLGMSSVTIDLMLLKYEGGKYNHVIKEALGKKDIWEILEDIFTVGGIMPPKVGKGRWKNFNKSLYDADLLDS